jgi:hypothetical protein
MRRSSLASFVGIVQADDDGNTAAGKITLDAEVEINAAIEKMQASKTLAELKIVYATAYSKFKGNKDIVKVYEEMKLKCT